MVIRAARALKNAIMTAAETGDWAPGWQVRCLKCGTTKPAGEVGVTRIAARGRKYSLFKCRTCDRLRWVAIERNAGGGGRYER